MIYEPKVDIILTSELAQILANLYCDGTIVETNCYTATYYNGYKELIIRFKDNVIRTFGKIDLYEWKTNVNAINLPAFIGKLLCQKFNLNEDRIPTSIINSSKEIKSAYLQAVFDDEGSVHSTHGQIRIKMKPKTYIEDLQKLVQEFDIETSQVIKEHDKRIVHQHLVNLKKQNFVDYTKLKRKFVYEYLWNAK